MPRPNLGPRLGTEQCSRTGKTLYVARWTEDGQRRKHSFGPCGPEEARQRFAAWIAGREDERRAGPGDPAQVTIEAVLRHYAKSHGQQVASAATLAYAITPMLVFFGGGAHQADLKGGWPRKAVTVAGLTYDLCRLYWDWRREFTIRMKGNQPTVTEGGVSDGTIIRELGGTLRPALKHAIGNRLLRGPAPLVQVPPQPHGRDLWITRDQAAALLREAMRDTRARLHLPLFILLALYTGARRGALLDLTWQQVDFVNERIDLNPPGRRQTAKRRPVVPMHPKLKLHLLRSHRRATCAHVIAYKGEPVGAIKTGFNSAADRAGIPDCTPHTLRHTAAVWMARAGVPLRQISGMLGHSESRTTELYAHHHPDHLRDAVRALG